MIQLHKQRLWHQINKFLFIQLTLTLISLPVLSYWGLSFSMASPIANFIFNPFLSLFLLLTSLIFFCELLYIPNTWLITALEYFTNGWLSLMAYGRSSWLIGINVPYIAVSMSIILGTIIILQSKKIASIPAKNVAFSLLFIGSITIIRLQAPSKSRIELSFAHETVTLIRDSGTTILIDSGALAKRISAPSWAQYTLLPRLNKEFGTTHINHLIASRPGTMLFKSLEALLQKTTIGTIYIPYWQGNLPKSGWRAYFELQRLAKKQGTKIIRIGGKKLAIPLNSHEQLHIIPQEIITKNGLQYRPIICAQKNYPK
ncbi:MAG: ComEC/Rec2 family competence protein [Candidatus Babeliales bacterium]